MAAGLLPMQPAAAAPAVDPYQAYVKPGCLSFVEQPGVKEFRDMMLSRAGGGNGGIFACSGYEHGEGRAWDWMMNANDAGQADKVGQVLNWLLATDAQGNPHAMARRLGIGNIIWNKRSISLWSYNNDKNWQPYSPCGSSSPPGVCHTNHVHFAFSWAGARQQTSWFTTADKPADWYPGGGAPQPGPVPIAEGRQAVFHHGFTSLFTVNAADGHLQESYLAPDGDGGWASQDLSAATGAPASSSQPVAVLHGNYLSVYTVNADGHLQETFSYNLGKWASQDLTTTLKIPAVTGRPAVAEHNGFVSVYTVDAGSGHLRESYLPPGDNSHWVTQDLTDALHTPPVSGNPATAVHNGFVSVYTIDGGSGHVRESYLPPNGNGGWTSQDLTAQAGTPAATGSPGTVVHSGFVSVYTITRGNNHLQESYLPPTGGGNWASQDLTAAAGTPATAPSTAPEPVLHDNYVSVYTTTTGGHLQETFSYNLGKWASQDLTAALKTPGTTSTPAAVVHDRFVSVYTTDTGSGHVREQYLPPTENSAWVTQDLTAGAHVPPARP
jgi:hypothetical protein